MWKKRKNKQVFIISTGRTGTKFFPTYFNKNAPLFGHHFYHETKPDIADFCFNYEINKYSKQEAKNIFLEKRLKLISKPRKVYLESNGNLGFIFPLIRELFKDSYFILVIRDPITFTHSVANRVLKTDAGEVQKYANDKYWLLKSDMFPNDQYYGKWNEFDMYEKIAWTWNMRNSTYLNYVENDKNSLVVRFEDIFLEPDKPGIDQINEFLKSTVKTRLKIKKTDSLFNQKVNTNKKQIDTTFGPEYIKNSKYFKELVGDLAERFNYPLP